MHRNAPLPQTLAALLVISFLASPAALAEEERPIPEWLARDLQSNDREVAVAAADAAGTLGSAAIDWLVGLSADDESRSRQVVAERVLTAVSLEVARERLPELLGSEAEWLAAAAAATAADLELRHLTDEVAAALERHPVYAVADALDRLAPTVESAALVLAQARRRSDVADDFKEEALYSIAYRRAPELFTDSERFEYLTRGFWAPLEIDQGPGIFEVDFTDGEPFRSSYTDEDLEFLKSRRDQLVPRLISRLESDGSRLAAVLLAWLGEGSIVPELRRRLLLADDAYGWETSMPTLFSEGNHRGYHAYSRAIEALTSKPLEEWMELSSEELAALKARSDGTALMLLHRLAPEIARDRVFELFRESRSFNCLDEGNTIHRYRLMEPGTSVEDAYRLLGPPDRETEDAAFYCCGNTTWAGDFRARLRAGEVVSFDSEHEDDDTDVAYCPDEPVEESSR